MDFTENVSCIIYRAIVDDNKLNSNVSFPEDFVDQITNSFSGIVGGDNDTNVYFLHTGLRFPFIIIFQAVDQEDLSFPDFLIDIK